MADVPCSKCGKLMQFWEPQNYGERGGEHVECPLTTLERIQQSYERHLLAHFTPDGESKPKEVVTTFETWEAVHNLQWDRGRGSV